MTEKTWELVGSSIGKQKELLAANVRFLILQHVIEAVHSSLDLEKVFERVTDGFVNSMGYTTAFIATLDEEKKHLEIRTFSTKKQLVSKIKKILGFSFKNFSFRADSELNDAISSAMKGKIVVVKTLAEIGYPLISKRKLMALQKLGGTKNCIIMPLSDKKEVVGGVVITSSQEEVSKEELGMIKSFAHAASQAIKNANLHHQAKQVEEELRKSEEKYKFLVDNSKEVILILSKTGKILFANKNALKNFGYSDEELIGKSITHFLTKDSIKKALYALTKEFFGHSQPVMEVRAKTKSGEIRYLEVAEGSTSIYDNKKLIGVMISATDITERKKAYEELKASEERLKILFEYAPDAYYLSDFKGNFIDGNIAAEKITGYSKEELIGKNFLKLGLLPPSQMLKAASSLAKNALGQPTGPEEFVLNRKDGNQIPVEISTYPVKIKGESLVLGIARDTTERKQAEEELRKSEMMYRALFEHANDAVFLLNFDGVHIAVNKKAADMLGYSIKELVGKSYKEIVAPHEFQQSQKKMKDLLDGKTFSLYERNFRKKDGTEFPVEINVSLVRDAESRPLFIQSIARDITERKKAEEQIKASLKEKEVLLQEIHHRVKNNMQIISSLVKLQSRLVTDPKALETFRSTQNRVRSMALIHERLYQSKDFARVDFNEYVRSLAGSLFSAYTVSSGDIQLHVDIKDVFVDINTAIPCGLIINELVSNSLKHAFPDGKKGQINITMHPLNKNEAELTFSDNGVGLPENVDFRNTESLGLHLVTILAEDQLHGNIKLDRKEGTKFQMKLQVRK